MKTGRKAKDDSKQLLVYVPSGILLNLRKICYMRRKTLSGVAQQLFSQFIEENKEYIKRYDENVTEE